MLLLGNILLEICSIFIWYDVKNLLNILFT